jgi:hypothetical protein
MGYLPIGLACHPVAHSILESSANTNTADRQSISTAGSPQENQIRNTVPEACLSW